MTVTSHPALGPADPIPSEIALRLRRWLTAQYGQSMDWDLNLVKTVGKAGRKRRILRARSADGQAIAFKAHASRLRNRAEFHALRHLHAIAPDSIAPLYLARDYKYYAMEWIDGPLLADALGGADHGDLIRQAGAWLARLHGHSTRRTLFDRRLPQLGLPWFPGETSLGQASARLKDRLRTVSLSDGPHAVLHGDFHAGNLFLRAGQPNGFDREEDCHGLVFLDAAPFLVDLAKRRHQARWEGRPWAGDIETDRRLFFEGYGPIEYRDLPLFDAIEDAFVFRSWRRLLRRGQDMMHPEMQSRGLLSDTPTALRPARLVAFGDGAVDWTGVPAAHHGR